MENLTKELNHEEFVSTTEAYLGATEDHKEYFIEDVVLKKKYFYCFVKRLFDFFSALIFTIILFVPMIILAILVKCTSKGPAFYTQKRVGLNGKEFTLIKYRTMRIDAEKDGAKWASENDERITKFGNFLRKSRLDELPQLWNILIGQMTIVGPRPEREIFYKEFDKYIHGFRQRIKVKPGMTGLAQVNGGYDLKPEEKIIFDVEYMKKRSIWLDIKIMFKTVAIVFNHKGAK